MNSWKALRLRNGRAAPQLMKYVTVAPGISAHIFGDVIGIYSERIEAGRGFVEMPLTDFAALVSHFGSPRAQAELQVEERSR